MSHTYTKELADTRTYNIAAASRVIMRNPSAQMPCENHCMPPAVKKERQLEIVIHSHRQWGVELARVDLSTDLIGHDLESLVSNKPVSEFLSGGRCTL